jgi:hypothetical protein
MPAKRELILERTLPPQEVKRLEKIQPWISSNGDPQHYTLISDCWELPGMFIDETCRARDKATGRLIFHFLRGVLQPREYELPWNYLRCGGTPVTGSGRGRTVGKGDPEYQDQDATERVIGFMNRQGGRFQYARRTGWTQEHEEEYRAVQPYLQRIDELSRVSAPDEWAEQRAVALLRPAYVMFGTAFSTGTANLGIRCTPHRDKGNLRLSAMTVTDLSRTPVQGGEPLLLEYLCGIDIRNEDLLLFDAHALHATAQFYTTASPSLIRGVQRLSCVFYYRAGLAKCLPPAEELRRAQQRMSASW